MPRKTLAMLALAASGLTTLCLGGCPEGDPGNSASPRQGRQVPEQPARPASPAVTGASSSPPATSSAGTGSGVGGQVESEARGVPTVRYVYVNPETIALNVPAPATAKPAGLAWRQVFEAEVVRSDGSPDPRGVIWSVSDTERLTIDSGGILSVNPAAAPGRALVVATAAGNSAVQAMAQVEVSADGLLWIDLVRPPNDPSLAFATVGQAGRYVASQQVGARAEFRLPAGSDYEVLVTLSSDSVVPQTATVSNLVILPGALTEATADLKPPPPGG